MQEDFLHALSLQLGEQERWVFPSVNLSKAICHLISCSLGQEEQ